MKYFSQCRFTYSDGTCFQLSQEFESSSDAVSWILFYMDLFSDFTPTFDIREIDNDLEAL